MYWIVLVGVLASSHLLPIIFEYHDPSQEIGGKHVWPMIPDSCEPMLFQHQMA